MNVDYEQTKILIVEDDQAVSFSLVEYLLDAGLPAVAAYRAEDALDLINNQSFQVVIVDLGLPGMSGEEFIVQAGEAAPGLRFLIHSGLPGPITPLMKAMGLEERHLLPKPLPSLELVVARVRELLASPRG